MKLILLFLLFTLSTALARSPNHFRKIKIAICQIVCLDGDLPGNLARIDHALAEAKAGGAEIACFPETALLGWVNPDAHGLAAPIPGEWSNRLGELAKKHGLYVSIGLAEKEGVNLYDSAILLDDRGNLLLKHRKINILTELMNPPYTPGSDVETVDTPLGRIGLLICADTFKDDILEKMAALKPDLVLVPYGWAAKTEEWPEHGESLKRVVQKTARTVSAPVIGTDLVGQITHGPWTGRTFGGQSCAADRRGNVLAVLKDRDREVRIVEVELPQRK